MSFVKDISIREANKHNYLHPMQFVGKINNCLSPWKLVDMDFKNNETGQMIMKCRILDTKRLGATRINDFTGESEEAKGIEVSFPLTGLLPTSDELELFIETIRQDLGIVGKNKIYMGRK